MYAFATFIPVASMSCPTKGIVSKPIINFLALRATLTVKILCVSQEVIFIGSKYEHVFDVDLTYVVYEAV